MPVHQSTFLAAENTPGRFALKAIDENLDFQLQLTQPEQAPPKIQAPVPPSN